MLTGNSSGLSEDQMLAADVNGNNELAVDDAQNILNYYVRNVISGETVTWSELLGFEADPYVTIPYADDRKPVYFETDS